MLLLLALISLTIGPFLDLDSSFHYSLPSHRSSSLQSETTQPTQIVRRVLSNVSILAEMSPGNLWASQWAQFYHGCSAPSKSFPGRISESESNGYIFVETSGGLNQQRIGITDAVVVARILNATLVVPVLDHGSFWRDISNFSDIFDLEWFIAALAPDLVIVKEVPAKLKIARELLYSTRAPRKCEPQYYIRNILPLLKRKKAIRLTKFDYRLANSLDEDLQKLRCRVIYNALRFTAAITDMGTTLVKRLKQRSRRYIAMHLRFESDMLAFTGCYYGGGEKERQELGEIRKRWITLSPINSKSKRRSGKCPLTPEETGLMLRALGFGSDSHIYVASGEIYGGEETLAPLRRLFPNIHSKETLATYMELQGFSSYASQMAAIDYIVCEQSDVFVTNYNGNMAQILAGSRRYFGHKRTIQPNVKKLGSLFLSRLNMTWNAFSSKLKIAQMGFIGEPNEVRTGGEFFEFPDSCICQNQEGKAQSSDMQQVGKNGNWTAEEIVQTTLTSTIKPDIDDPTDENMEENILMQKADLENQANAIVQTKDGESEDIPWLSDK